MTHVQPPLGPVCPYYHCKHGYSAYDFSKMIVKYILIMVSILSYPWRVCVWGGGVHIIGGCVCGVVVYTSSEGVCGGGGVYMYMLEGLTVDSGEYNHYSNVSLIVGHYSIHVRQLSLASLLD